MMQNKRSRLVRLMLGGIALPMLATALEAQTNSPTPGTQEQAAAAAPSSRAAPSQPWPQSVSDVPADKSVRFGTLPNGMRYAIMHNATPPGQASLMLRIDAGSLMEKDDQLGLAHFMEHMAFNGTTHIPKNELISILERLGLSFGADLNAATGFDETFYQLQLPHSDDKTVDTGLYVLREQVSEATMDPQDIIDERGVIAGEERLRNSPSLRAGKKQMAVLAKGQKIVDRFPIGDLRIINTATRDRFVDFYNSYYRPSRATIVAVGDFDVSAMEAKIRKQFSDWQPKGVAGPDPDLGKPMPQNGRVSLVIEPGAPSNISLTWVRPPDLTPDSLALRRKNMIEEIGFAVLNRRLEELSRTDNLPFFSANAGDSNVMRSLRATSVSAQFDPGKWKPALEAIDREQRRLTEFGITEAELTREITTLRTRYETKVKSANTRATPNLSSALINSVNDRAVYTSPQTDLDLFEAAVKGLTPARVDGEIKSIFAGTPMTMVMSPVPIDGGETAIAAASTAARALAVTAPKTPAIMPWPYTNFGKPGAVVSKAELANLGATVVTFDNGTILTFKHTDFSKDSVLVNVATGLGEQAFSPDKVDPRFVMIGDMRMGGLGKMNVDDISRSLAGHVYGAGLSVDGRSFEIGGPSTKEDLQLQMQVMAAYLTDPAFRTTNFDKTKASYPAIYDMTLAQPAGAFQVYAKSLLAGGDQREAVLPPEALSAMSMEPYREQLKTLLSKGPLRVTMVGDTTLEEAIRVTANTFGALPKRPAADAPAPGADQRRFPAPTPEPLRFTHKGVAEQSLGYVAWPAVDVAGDMKEARRIMVMTQVLRLRVLDEIRERQALAYAPSTGSEFSETYKGFGSISINAQAAPDKLPAFFRAVDLIAQKMRDEPITEDELKRAREPMIAGEQRKQKGNAWWFTVLAGLGDHPQYETQALTGAADMMSVTTADIQALARKYLRPELAWKAEVVPQDTNVQKAAVSK